MHVYAHPPNVGPHGTSVNVVLSNGDRKVSVCCDDSCGALSRLSRSDLRLLDGDNDVTGKVLGEEADANCAAYGEALKKALEWVLAGSE